MIQGYVQKDSADHSGVFLYIALYQYLFPLTIVYYSVINYLTENATYRVYAIYESVYLATKNLNDRKDDHDAADLHIAWHYGDPTSAFIMPSNKHVIIAGCGLSIYDIEKDRERHLLAETDNIHWTNGLHQGDVDDASFEFRFVAQDSNNQLRVFRMHILTEVVEEL